MAYILAVAEHRWRRLVLVFPDKPVRRRRVSGPPDLDADRLRGPIVRRDGKHDAIRQPVVFQQQHDARRTVEVIDRRSRVRDQFADRNDPICTGDITCRR